MLRNLVKKGLSFLSKTQDKKVPLGRWNTSDNNGIKSVLANSDHCGDTICKDPKLVSKFVKMEVEKFEKKHNKQ